ncbi:MAG TPA: phage tail tube protein [Candidatus Binatia bacterium]|nr:phage tail tube protein [Candidatus Binatia bacterium]
MAEADTSNSRFAIVKESSIGVNPGTGAKYMRGTSFSGQEKQNRTTSAEVNGNRNPRENVRTSANPEVSVDFEFSPNNLDNILEGAMMSAAFAAAPSLLTGNIQAVAAGPSFTTSGTPSLAGIAKGQWFQTSTFTNAANNGWFRAAAASTSTSVTVEAGSGIVDEASASRKLQVSSLITIGTTRVSFSAEKQFPDVSVFEQFNGLVIDQLSMRFSDEQIITGSINFMGTNSVAAATSTGMGTVAAAGTELIAAAVDTLRGLKEGSLGADATHKLTELSLQISNKARVKRQITALNPFDIGIGVAEITLQATLYLRDKSVIDKFRNNTVTPFSWRIIGRSATDPSYVFTVPQGRITVLDDPIPGNSQDAYQNVTIVAETDANNIGFQIDKIIAIP